MMSKMQSWKKRERQREAPVMAAKVKIKVKVVVGSHSKCDVAMDPPMNTMVHGLER